MNVREEMVAVVMDVSILQEVIIALVEEVTDYTTKSGAGVCDMAFSIQPG